MAIKIASHELHLYTETEQKTIVIKKEKSANKSN